MVRALESLHRELEMPQELHVGYRSRLVTSLAWLLMLTGLCGLVLAGYRGTFAFKRIDSLEAMGLSLLVCGALLTVLAGQALLRRHEWGRRLAAVLLVLLVPALPALPLVTEANLFLLVPSVIISAVLVWMLRALGRPVVRQEFI
jgi:hypothetical protein